MQKSSLGRKSSTNPTRFSAMDRDDKISTTRSEPRISNLNRPVRQSAGDNSQIPRPRIRSASSERGSSIRKSNLKVPGKTPISGSHYSLATPVGSRVSSTRIHPDLPTGYRGRSPSAERASGLGSNNTGQKKDTRPLTDKNYQTMMLNRIDNFFRDANQLSILNPNGSLKPVSLKIFVNASDFLLRLLDTKHDFTINNYMEELPKIAKKLHYPGTMAKSWLKTANTLHAWHHVLGWLCWLVEVCEVKDIATEQFQLDSLPFTDDGDGEVINRNQFGELLKLYQVWNDGNLEGEELLINKYIESIANNCGFTENDVRIAESELADLTKKCDDMIKYNEEINQVTVTLNEKLQMLQDEENKLIAQEQSRNDSLHAQEMEIQRMEAEMVRMDKEKIELLQQHEELNSLIEQQSMTVEERDKILKKCTEIKSYLKQFDNHLDEIQKEEFTLNMKCLTMIDDLRKAILEYNTEIVINITQDKNQFKMPESSLDNSDIMIRLNEKVEAIMNLKETMMKELKICKSSIEVYTNEMETLQEKRKMMDREANEWRTKIDEKRDCIKNLKLRTTKEEKAFRELNKKLEEEIKKLQQSSPNIQLVMDEIKEAKEKYEAVERRKIFLERSAERFFTRFYEIISHDWKELVNIIEDISIH
ncbi:hypothetical protein PV326_001922 [Microctonus aethiopoides]|uniref:Kinetochore protein NDC80 n=1 Tax=Microctonus aethiopoides TaxID=144406 RepID=A0AA39F6M8_9HYME|nr:hypothetical protein PV326_001922 [Microctonus aethiopoides]KAK0163849.1 hypothetical protein PV328_002538 [Microctonus aethiopoides]